MNAEELFTSALAQVESKSIREWANSTHNRPLFLRIAETYLGEKDAPTKLCISIVSNAIGL